MPRILIFSTAYLPLVGGAEVAIKEITDRLSTEYEFVLVTARLHKELPRVQKMGAVTVYRIGFGSTLDKFLLPVWGFFKMLPLVRRKSPVLFWVVIVSYAGYIAYLLNLFSSKKIPILLTLQEGDSEAHIEYGKGGLIAYSWKLMLRQASLVTAISTYLAQRAVYFGYRNAVRIIPNGVNTSILANVRSVTNRLHIEKGPEDIFLLTTSRLVQKNGLDSVIRALHRTPQNIKFLIVGAGGEEQKLRMLSQMEGVSERVQFFGQVPPEEVPAYLAIGDIFIRPSLSEGMGNSFIEAMAAGLPVIGTQVGGISDFLFDRERNPDKSPTGFAVDINNPDQIAGQITYILNNREEVLKTVENARALVQEKYDWNLIAREMREVFVRAKSERL